MIRLHVVQAEYGDCLILESGTPSDPRYILVDGGPATVYATHLRDELQKIRDGGGKLDIAILSHVDTDHVTGLLDLIAELREQQASGKKETIAIDALWHNTFSQTIGRGNDIEARIETLRASVGARDEAMAIAGMVVEGIGEGHQLSLAASALGLPINLDFHNGLVSLDEAPKTITLGNLSLHVVGPTERNLARLREEWLDWLDAQEEGIATRDPFFAAMADRSFRNLSSIMLLAEAEGKRILLTGDGRGDHLLQGLDQAGLLSPEGGLHVDVLKIPHHGSDRNVNRAFFRAITADVYVISANGRHGNPDLATLIWIVEAAREQGRGIEILVTNWTPSTQKLAEEYDPEEYGYRLTEMEKGGHAVTLELTG